MSLKVLSPSVIKDRIPHSEYLVITNCEAGGRFTSWKLAYWELKIMMEMSQ